MVRRIRRLPSPALIVASIALVLAAAGGIGYAASKISGKSIKRHSIAGNRLKKNTVTGKRIKESTLGKVPKAKHADTADSATNATNAETATNIVPPEAFHEVGGAGEPAFQNGATNFGAGFTTAGFYKDRECVVHLKGTINATSGLTAFTLPSADLPAQNQFGGIAVGGPIAGNVEVLTTGAVEPFAQGGGANVFGLDGFSFRAAVC